MKINRILAVAVSAALTGSMMITAWAGPGTTQEASTYDAATLAKLQDNTIEYDELLNLIREYNPTISQAWKTYSDKKADYQYIVDEMQSQYHNVKDTADLLKSIPDPSMAQIGTELDKSYKSTLSSYKKVVDEWDTSISGTAAIRQGENQMLNGVQQIMIGYSTVQANMDTLNTMLSMYSEISSLKEKQVELGMATQTELLSAQKDVLSAQSQLASLQVQAQKLKESLILMTGWQAGANPTIMPIPSADVSRIAAMNPTTDLTTAIGNNYTLISQRHAKSSSGSTAARENRTANLEVGEQNLSIELQRLYQDVLDKKAAYDAASTGFQSATLSHQASERQLGLGLLSKSQYLGTQISYYSKKAAYDSANIALFQSMEAYDWALKGIANVG